MTSINCPVCVHPMQQVHVGFGAHWCPRCGTLAQHGRMEKTAIPTFLTTVVGTMSRMECQTPQGHDPSPLSGVLWGKVAHFFGLGSTSATAFCYALGFNASDRVPEENA